MNRRIIIIAVSIVGVVLLLSIAAYFLLRRGGVQNTVVDENGEQVTFLGNLPESGNVPGASNGDNEPGLTGVGVADPGFAVQVIAEDLKKQSKNLIERLGSYSSDSSLSNFDDILYLTTPTFELAIRDMKSKRLEEFSKAGTFSGYTVRSVTASANIESIDDGRIIVTVNAQRQIVERDEAERTEAVVYTLTWNKGEDGAWRVNAITGTY